MYSPRCPCDYSRKRRRPSALQGGPCSPPAPRRHHKRRRPTLSRRHDQSYKLLFSLPLAVEHLVCRYIDDGLAGELDFDRVEYLATERAAAGLTRSLADLVCRIHFRGSSRYLLFAVEFQSAVDRYMALRALTYVAGAYRGLVASRGRKGTLGPRSRLAPALTVTVYNGRRPWTAPNDVFDLIEPVRGWLASRQPKLRHQVLDLRELARQPPTEANVVSWVASLELDPSPGNVTRVVREVLETFPGSEHARLREAFREWGWERQNRGDSMKAHWNG